MKPMRSETVFIIMLVLLNLALALYATPVTNLNDSYTYIQLSKSILGQAIGTDLQHRSPLFSIILAGFMLVFEIPLLFKAVVIFQYFLVAVTVWITYLLFKRLFAKTEHAMAVALLFNLSFSTIYYANILLTETISVFFLIASVFLLLRVHDDGSRRRIFALGAALGLLSLARFNTIPLIVTFTFLLAYILFRHRIPMKKWLLGMGVFLLAYAIPINLWCLRNYEHYGTYRLFPKTGMNITLTPRHITIAAIRPESVVSEKNKPLLEIFLKAREKYLNRDVSKVKGSLAKLDKNGILPGLYSGYPIFLQALPELRAYFKSNGSENQLEMSTRLNSFLKEIAAQNHRYLMKNRFYSFLSGFRASVGGALPVTYGKINLNFLPDVFFVIFKLFIFFTSIVVFFAFFYFVVDTIRAKFLPNVTLLVMFFVIFSFWGINFIFFTVGDANRFKFLAEPLIIGLFVFYSAKLFGWLKNKRLQLRRKDHAENL